MSAFLIRAVAYALPLGAAYLSVRMLSSTFYRPAGWLGLAIWIVQAVVVAALVSRGVARLTRRLLPLATLFTTTLVFPDRAPSRFGVALRSGTVKQMRKRAVELSRDGLGATEREAAENAIVLVTGLGRHDRLTRGHTERVRAYADLLADEMHLSTEDRHRLAWGVLLHDVGKMTVPPEILNKVERLTESEWEILKNHPAAGEQMLVPLSGWLGQWGRAAGEHHERWDGRGYPRGLAGNDISLAGRITAVADAYDVITSKRSYKDPMSAEAARRELVDCAGEQFDPAVVRAFLDVSLGHRPDVGALAWLTEIPIVRAAGAFAGSPVAASVGAAALATSTMLGLGDDSAARRDAFAAELSSSISIPAADQQVDDAVDALDEDDPHVPTSIPDAPEPTTSTTSVPDPTGIPTPEVPDGTPDDVVPPPVTVPSTTVPSTTVPVPPVTVPPVTVLPSITVPSVTVPSVTVLPSISVPSVTVLPSISIPGVPVTTPAVTIPEVTVPEVTVPEVTLPEVTLPEIKLPLFG